MAVNSVKMVKKNKTKKARNKNIFLFIVFFTILGLSAIAAIKIIINYGVKEREEKEIQKQKEINDYKEWLVENCKCIEREIILCPEGFKLNENKTLCRNVALKTITHRMLACSKYDCEGDIHELNYEHYKD